MRCLIVFFAIMAVAIAASIKPPQEKTEPDEPLESPEEPENDDVQSRSGKPYGKNSDSNIHNLEYKSEADKDGFKFSYKNDDGTQEREEGHFIPGPNNTVEQAVNGSYQYVDKKTGKSIKITYTADKYGYHPSGDILPVAPPSPDYVLALLELIAKTQRHNEEENDDSLKGNVLPKKPRKPTGLKNTPLQPSKPNKEAAVVNKPSTVIEKEPILEKTINVEEEKNNNLTGEEVEISESDNNLNNLDDAEDINATGESDDSENDDTEDNYIDEDEN